MTAFNKEQRARNRAIYNARMSGETYASIGAQYGISKERVRQIVEKVKRINRWEKQQMTDALILLINAMMCLKPQSVAQAWNHN